MQKLIRHRSIKTGRPPGTLEFVGDVQTSDVKVTATQYNATELREFGVDVTDQSVRLEEDDFVTWVQVKGLHDVNTIESVTSRFGVHPLDQEDILNTAQRPKCEEHDDYVFVSLKILKPDLHLNGPRMEQVSLIITRRTVVSIQESDEEIFDPIGQRLHREQGRIRRMPADYLAYCLVDLATDGYFPVLETLADKIELAETSLLENPTPETLQSIYRLKREGLLIHRNVWPLREVADRLARMDSPMISDEINTYLHDVYDHSVQIIDTLEVLREMLSGMHDTYLSSLSNRMNDIMKTLTIIATVFIPLTFVAGIYGMNFKHMPELDWRFGYEFVLGIMTLIAAGLLWFFRKRRWF